jgi:hypothetical protein
VWWEEMTEVRLCAFVCMCVCVCVCAHFEPRGPRQ